MSGAKVVKNQPATDQREEIGDYDLIVLGGGLAGLCLSIQVKQADPDLRILVLERGKSPVPDAAHKVGESSVEVASHYFRNVLRVEDLIEKEVPKFGLRFFMSDGENRDIANRLEYGPKNFLTMPSDQIDRGQFENGLAERAIAVGVDLRNESKITDVDFFEPVFESESESEFKPESESGVESDSGSAAEVPVGSAGRPGGEPHAEAADDAPRRMHSVAFTLNGRSARARAPWVVDASGRAGVLKKKFGVGRRSRHSVNASWFRIDAPIDVDDWSEDEAFGNRVDDSRRLSTNHFMGPGYWVWFIPLAHDRTSVGVVAEEGLHPFTEIHSFEKTLNWLEDHEPQAAAVVRSHEERGERMDFLALKQYSHDARQVFSAKGWALTGDAGIFIDPLYSPGSDFVAMSNSFISDLIVREARGENIEPVATAYDKAFRSLAQTYLVNYYRQYPLMGHARIMISKIIWDFTMYWGGVAILFCGDRLCNPAFMERANPILQSFAFTNLSMQAYFREWAKHAEGERMPSRAFVDYAGLDFLAELNANLGQAYDDDELLAQMNRNLALAKSLRVEIQAEAARTDPSLLKDETPPMTGHLEKLYETLRASVSSDSL